MLEGLKVIEFAEGIAGPLAALRLAELGAQVTKVEEGEGDYMPLARKRASTSGSLRMRCQTRAEGVHRRRGTNVAFCRVSLGVLRGAFERFFW